MRSLVLVESHESILGHAKISLLGAADEWVDVSSCVQAVTVRLKAGEPARASLDVVLVDADGVEAQELDNSSLFAMASVLRLYGWKVGEPSDDHDEVVQS